MPAPDVLTPLRKLGGPGALVAECAVCSRLEDKLAAAGERCWTELQQANCRLQKAQLEVEEKLAAIRKNLGEREAILDRHETLLDMREAI